MKNQELLDALSVREKIELVSGTDFMYTNGVERLGVKRLSMADGPHGVRKQIGYADNGIATSEPATSFPTAVTTASGWNVDNLLKMGEAIGKECLSLGVDILLGPGVNIKKNPLCGRNFEYFSEDPYLAGVMGAAHIKGVQSVGVGACVKHFALPYNMLLVKGDEALSRAALREKLVSSLALEVGTVVGFEDVMHEKVGTLQNYVTCANLLLAVVLIFTLLGLADNLYESYRRRAGEFSLFAYGGMSRSLCRKMKCYELLLTFGLGILAGSLIAIPSFLAVRAGLFGRGYDLWINLLRAL